MSDFTCPVGDTLKLIAKAYATSSRKSIYDLTGKDLLFTAVDDPSDPTITIEKVLEDGISVPVPSTGEAEVTLSTEDTSCLGIGGGTLRYKLQILDGIDIYTVSWGKIHLKQII